MQKLIVTEIVGQLFEFLYILDEFGGQAFFGALPEELQIGFHEDLPCYLLFIIITYANNQSKSNGFLHAAGEEETEKITDQLDG